MAHMKAKNTLTEQEQAEIKAKSGDVIRRIPLVAIKLDPEVYPAAARHRLSVKAQLQLLLAGDELPPPRVIRGELQTGGTKTQYLLADGYAVWKVYQQRARLHKQGKLNLPLSQVDLETIRVELVDAPVYQSVSNSLRNRVRQFYEDRPGYPERRAAKELECDIKTIKKYATDLIVKWKEERRQTILQMSAQGYSNRDIMKALKARWPSARGLSQSVISRMIRDPASMT